MPVLPLVGSTIVSPGFSRPSRSAVSIILSAMRSLTLPAGFIDSTFASTSAQPACTSRLRRTIGVSPTRSRTESAIFLSFRIIIPLYHVSCAARREHAVALRQVRDRRTVQDAQYSFPHGLPHIPLRAAAVLRARARLLKTVGRHDR